MSKKTFIFLYFLLICSLCNADALFGPEFTFTNDRLISSYKGKRPQHSMGYSLALLRKWEDRISSLCKTFKCVITPTSDKHGQAYRVTFEDDWWLQISQDMMVLEVQTAPATISGFKGRKEVIESLVFNLADSIGLKPHERIGGGHINIDMKTAFGDNPLLFRNFIVDHANYPELSWGVFGSHLGNSPPIASLGHDQVEAFLDVVYEFDTLSEEDYIKEGFIIDKNTILALEIEDRVYTSNPIGWGDSEYNQALNFRNIESGKSPRLEIRSYRPQRTLSEFIMQITYLQERLNFLNRRSDPVNVKIPSNWDPVPEVKKEVFKSLILEMGLDYDNYQALIPARFDRFHSLKPINFNSAKGNSSGLTCSALFN